MCSRLENLEHVAYPTQATSLPAFEASQPRFRDLHLSLVMSAYFYAFQLWASSLVRPRPRVTTRFAGNHNHLCKTGKGRVEVLTKPCPPPCWPSLSGLSADFTKWRLIKLSGIFRVLFCVRGVKQTVGGWLTPAPGGTLPKISENRVSGAQLCPATQIFLQSRRVKVG